MSNDHLSLWLGPNFGREKLWTTHCRLEKGADAVFIEACRGGNDVGRIQCNAVEKKGVQGKSVRKEVVDSGRVGARWKGLWMGGLRRLN